MEEILEEKQKNKFKWFPGHMKKALDDIEDNKIKLADVILYVLDARAPVSCMNPNVNKIVHGKPIIYIFNKIDLADEKRVKEIQSEFERQDKVTLLTSATNPLSKASVKNTLKNVLSSKIQKNKEKGKNVTYKVLVLGVPNTGKSSIINMFAGKKKATTGNTPGVTKINQWIKIDDEFLLLDTPGVLWPKFDETNEISKNLAFIGSLSEKEFDLADLGYDLLKIIYEKYPENIINRFGIENSFDEFIEFYDKICLKRGFKTKGNEIDYNRAGKAFIDEFRSGKLGKITLE